MKRHEKARCATPVCIMKSLRGRLAFSETGDGEKKASPERHEENPLDPPGIGRKRRHSPRGALVTQDNSGPCRLACGDPHSGQGEKIGERLKLETGQSDVLNGGREKTGPADFKNQTFNRECRAGGTMSSKDKEDGPGGGDDGGQGGEKN